MRDERIQAAWREKVALCIIVFVMCLLLAFITFGLSIVVCRPSTRPVHRIGMVADHNEGNDRWFIIHGMIYNIPTIYKPYAHKLYDPYQLFATMDISVYFPWTPDCPEAGVNMKFKCKNPGTDLEHCHAPQILNNMEYVADVAYEWKDIEGTTRLVFNGEVLDVGFYLDQIPIDAPYKPFGDDVDRVFRSSTGGDVTKALGSLSPSMRACIKQNFRAGYLEVKTIGCIITDVVLYLSLVAILSLVLAKFFLAVAFAFVMARWLGRPSEGKPTDMGDALAKRSRSSSSMALKTSRYSAAMHRPYTLNNPNSTQSMSGSNVVMRYDSTNSPNHMYTILLVTCYSEDEAGLRITLDSLTETDYDDTQKLLFVIADGIITGSGNEKSTPDTVLGMMELVHDRFEAFQFDDEGRPELHSYVAIADGTKRNNMARVYAGLYRCNDHTVPIILVAKCGSPAEADKPKPGNRGKRDSQIVLMSFLSKVLFDDRMTPLEYDLFFKIYRLTGIMPDQYEAVLMVDADTKVMPAALTKLTAVFRRDASVMGLCGETRIANKGASWVSMIQVFEYYISHHLSKAFESVFGGVTCLPGCFCMYRIKSPKNGGWIPVLASPDILNLYSENVTDTLHKKNLLLLGEDRYLTTLMLKTFPRRKLIFVPQAICKTMVPDTFRVLLSQRRRWINSTIHNLFELVLVPDLCGTFCCSMQFVVFMELVGTLVLPAAIVFTGVLIASTFLTDPQWIPLFLLAAILGLPALLILFTTRKLMYIVWFLIYIVALPIWNFVLPVYAFWHFDDFSWGETRKIDGAATDDHGKSEGQFDSSQIYMKRWHEFEKERIIKSERWLASGGGFAANTYVPVMPSVKTTKEDYSTQQPADMYKIENSAEANVTANASMNALLG
jgi:chitin synthase